MNPNFVSKNIFAIAQLNIFSFVSFELGKWIFKLAIHFNTDQSTSVYLQFTFYKLAKKWNMFEKKIDK